MTNKINILSRCCNTELKRKSAPDVTHFVSAIAAVEDTRLLLLPSIAAAVIEELTEEEYESVFLERIEVVGRGANIRCLQNPPLAP